MSMPSSSSSEAEQQQQQHQGPVPYSINPKLSVTRIGSRAYYKALELLAPQIRLELAQAEDARKFATNQDDPILRRWASCLGSMLAAVQGSMLAAVQAYVLPINVRRLCSISSGLWPDLCTPSLLQACSSNVSPVSSALYSPSPPPPPPALTPHTSSPQV